MPTIRPTVAPGVRGAIASIFLRAACDVNRTLLPAILQIQPFWGHNLSYCILLKKNPDIYARCKLAQKYVKEKLRTNGSFCGTCFAGMGEYVFRIAHNDVYLGFISVSGVCFRPSLAKEKLLRLCRRYGLNEADLQKGFAASVTPVAHTGDTPPQEITVYVTPLLRMLELLYLEQELHPDNRAISPERQVFLSAKSYINDNFTNDITVKDICEHLHYSRSYVSHVFVRYQAATMVDYINTLRIAKAQELLGNTDYSVSEIAIQVGFNEPNYFTNTFKKYAKTTPTKYRRQRRADLRMGDRL